MTQFYTSVFILKLPVDKWPVDYLYPKAKPMLLFLPYYMDNFSFRHFPNTTTLKLMQIMHDKQLVTRTTEGAKGRSHIYSASVQESQISNNLLEGFIQRVFQGATSQMVLRALGRKDASPEELEEIRKYLDQLDKK